MEKYFAMFSDSTRIIQIVSESYKNFLEEDGIEKFSTIEESFKLLDKYYFFDNTPPKEIVAYIKANVSEDRLAFNDDGTLIGYEDVKELNRQNTLCQ